MEGEGILWCLVMVVEIVVTVSVLFNGTVVVLFGVWRVSQVLAPLP